MVTNNPVSVIRPSVRAHGSQGGKGKFYCLRQHWSSKSEIGVAIWESLMSGINVGLHLYRFLLWGEPLLRNALKGEFQFQMWPTTWVNTFSNTKRKLKSTILNPNCFLFCFVFFSFTQASPQLTFSCLSILHAEITGVSCHARLALLSGSQMRNLEKMTMWKCLQMLKYFFCESVYGRQYYQLSLLWGLHG